MRTGLRRKFFFCPKCSPVHENRAKVIISPTCFATFRDISLFRFCFCDCFFRGVPRVRHFQWDSQNRKFGGITSTKRRNLLKNPLEVPKRTLWRAYNSSLRSRVAHTEPISVTGQGGPGGPTGPNGIFSMGLAKSKIWR